MGCDPHDIQDVKSPFLICILPLEIYHIMKGTNAIGVIWFVPVIVLYGQWIKGANQPIPKAYQTVG